MRLSHMDEKIVRIMKEGYVEPAKLAEMLGRGYTELKAQSMVLRLANAGFIDKVKAALFLRGTAMVKFLGDTKHKGLVGKTPFNG